MRAIDADAMIDRLKEWDTKDKTDKALYNFTLNRINEQPTIHPEIVRCKDCKYAEYINDVQTLWCTECGQGRTVAPNDFCSYGEKERGGQDG